MKLFQWFFLFLILFLVLIISIWFSEAPESATGIIHPEFKSMLHSGSSVASTPIAKWLAYFFGLAVLSMFGMGILTGAQKQPIVKDRKIKKQIIIGMSAYMLVFTFMCLAYWEYVAENDDRFFLGFPIPTAWMLYGLGAVPIIFTFFYVRKFDSWILTQEEEKRFQEILKERKELIDD